MIGSSLIIYPSVYNNAPIAGRRSESDSQLSTGYTWNIEYTGGYYYITYTQNGTKYYVKSYSTENDAKLIFTTNANDSGTKWTFNKYTGNVYENIQAEDFNYQLAVGDTYQYVAYMRSTRIGHNGPVYYSVADPDGSTTDRATINPQTGLLTAQKYGRIQLRVSYPGAPWIWYWYVSIGGTFAGEVPTSLRSNANHMCIPCAVTNIASFWCVSEGLTQYKCQTVQELEDRAEEVQEAMKKAGSHTANAYIQYGYNIFTHTKNGNTYMLQSANCWASQGQFDWNSIVSEINAGRPVMLGFASGNGSPYNSHMTVCVGYSVENGVRYVLLSDAHNDGYMRQPFDEAYNDFISKVTIVTG